MTRGAGASTEPAAATPRVRRCADRAEFAGMAAGWNRLVDRSPAPSLYLTHEWMSGWLSSGSPGGAEPYVLLAHDGDTLEGIAPLVRRRVPGTGLVRLDLMTMGAYAYAPSNLSGSLDFIAGARGENAIDAMAEYLSAHGDEWNYLRLHPVPESSPTIPRITAWAERSGYGLSVRRVFSNAVVDLPATFAEYRDRLTTRFRKNLKRVENIAAKENGMRIVEVRSADEAGPAIEEMIRIERRSWKHSGGLSLEAPSVRMFYEAQALSAARRGALTLWFLEVGGVKVAYDLGIVHGGRVEILKGSFDRGLARLSPGTLLTIHEMRAFIARGYRSVNLLWGDLSYKIRWAAREEPCCEIYVCNKRPASRIFFRTYIATGAYRGIRYLRNLPGRRSS